MFIKSDKDQRYERMITNLTTNTDITSNTAGGIARAFVEMFNEEFDYILDTLDINMVMQFVSTATGTFLDYIGALLNCARLSNETDDNYRYRITQQVNTVASANEAAIRLKCLAVDGVSDVLLTPFEKGAGSFAVYVITEDAEPSDDVLATVTTVVEETKALGVYSEVKALNPVYIGFTIRLMLSSTASATEQASIIANVKANVKSYLDNIVGVGIVTLVQIGYIVMAISTKIQNAEIVEMTVNNSKVAIRDYEIAWNERVISTIEVS